MLCAPSQLSLCAPAHRLPPVTHMLLMAVHMRLLCEATLLVFTRSSRALCFTSCLRVVSQGRGIQGKGRGKGRGNVLPPAATPAPTSCKTNQTLSSSTFCIHLLQLKVKHDHRLAAWLTKKAHKGTEWPESTNNPCLSSHYAIQKMRKPSLYTYTLTLSLVWPCTSPLPPHPPSPS